MSELVGFHGGREKTR